MHADAWAALAKWVTAAIAFGAALYARNQVSEARKTRESVAQPNVVVFVDHNRKNWQYMDFVVKNFGQTPAYNIRLTHPELDVVPHRSGITGEMVTKLATPTHIAVLAPGQEWRAVWFSAVKWEEYDGELRKLYEGNVTFTDTRTPIPGKKPYDNPISLNVQTFRNTMRLKEIEPARLVAEQIAAVAATLDSYHKDDSGIWVYTLSGDEERQRREQEDKEQYAAWKQGYDELTRSMWPDSEPEEPNPDETSNEAEPQ